MIQVNLLPDLKREYLHAQQTKHSFIVASVLASIIALGALVFIFVYVQFLQPQHRQNLQTDIDAKVSEMKSLKDAPKIVSVQGALEQLPGLQDKKWLSSRLFEYIKAFTPRGSSYNEIKLDLATSSISLTGTAQNYEQANVLANNIKSAQLSYTQADSAQKIAPFTAVVFENLSRGEQTDTGNVVSFQLNFTINPLLFNQSVANPQLAVNAASSELLLPTAQPFSGGAE